MPHFSTSDLITLAVFAAGAVWFLFFRGKTAALSPQDLKDLRLQGAVILDVRTPAEFAQGHVQGSRNIPLGDLPGRLGELKKETPILACCASGMRSGRAVGILRQAGFTQVHNVGSWSNLKD